MGRVVDGVDVYSPGPAPTGTYLGTFPFQGGVHASFWMDINEGLGTDSTATFVNGLGRGCLPADHELAFSRTRSLWKTDADLVVVVGDVNSTLACSVVCDHVVDAVAFRRGVLWVASHVEIQPCSVLKEDVGRSAPADDPAEQVPGYLVR